MAKAAAAWAKLAVGKFDSGMVALIVIEEGLKSKRGIGLEKFMSFLDVVGNAMTIICFERPELRRPEQSHIAKKLVGLEVDKEGTVVAVGNIPNGSIPNAVDARTSGKPEDCQSSYCLFLE